MTLPTRYYDSVRRARTATGDSATAVRALCDALEIIAAAVDCSAVLPSQNLPGRLRDEVAKQEAAEAHARRVSADPAERLAQAIDDEEAAHANDPDTPMTGGS